jgi:hypothetical protein
VTNNFRKQIDAQPPRLVRRAELRRIVPLADTTIYDMECKGLHKGDHLQWRQVVVGLAATRLRLPVGAHG